jgi:hypothetical protein
MVLNSGDNRFREFPRFVPGFVHFPIASNNCLSGLLSHG